jgi:predicted nucleic acid-binding protein
LIKSAAGFKARFRISMADAVALALAEKHSAPLVTCDHHEFDPIETSGQARFLWIR